MVLLAAPAAVAANPDAAACKAARKSAVVLRADKQLRDARQPLSICVASTCPADVRRECTRLTAEIEEAIPTIIFAAKDASGREVKAVEVNMDGQPLADKLDGSPLEVDLGVHEFTFTAEGWAPVTLKLDVGSGEKRRIERVAMKRADGDVAEAAPPAPIPEVPAAPSTPTGKPNTVTLVTGGLGFAGLTGLVLGGIYGMLALSWKDQQKNDCANLTLCRSHAAALSDHSSALSDGTISTVAFVAGGVFLAGAAGYYWGGRVILVERDDRGGDRADRAPWRQRRGAGGRVLSDDQGSPAPASSPRPRARRGVAGERRLHEPHRRSRGPRRGGRWRRRRRWNPDSSSAPVDAGAPQ